MVYMILRPEVATFFTTHQTTPHHHTTSPTPCHAARETTAIADHRRDRHHGHRHASPITPSLWLFSFPHLSFSPRQPRVHQDSHHTIRVISLSEQVLNQ
ncbi:hypothetical protein RIF29_14254 [Crotalaria pallida]|uniref:Uncharacterized protein n=1 Tax=Crotalaria pallida TaxID=3830 RepID=A0AAN9IDL5_CROPI